MMYCTANQTLFTVNRLRLLKLLYTKGKPREYKETSSDADHTCRSAHDLRKKES
jgi:hypothetical protein